MIRFSNVVFWSLLSFIASLQEVAMATTYSAPFADSTVLSKYCFVKSELPPGLEINTIKDKLEIKNSAKSTVKLFLKKQEHLEFPLSLKESHLPVYIVKNGKHFVNEGQGFRENTYSLDENPLAFSGMGTGVSLGPMGQIPRTFPVWQIDKNDLEKFLELPVKFYIGNKFHENKIKIYTKPKTEHNQSGVAIYKIEPSSPFPAGMSITFKNNAFEPEFNAFYSYFSFLYKGSETVTYVKEFKENLEDFNLIKSSQFPFYIGKEGSCFKLNGENNYLISRVDGKKYYDRILESQKNYFTDGDGVSEDDKKNYFEQIGKIDLHHLLPLGFMFPGNGIEKQDCIYEENLFSGLFKENSYQTQEQVKPQEIDIPADEVATINILNDGKMGQLNFLKRYYPNSDWRPIYKKGRELVSCTNYCPPPEKWKKKDYLKDAKINYPSYKWKDEDLVCLRSR